MAYLSHTSLGCLAGERALGAAVALPVGAAEPFAALRAAWAPWFYLRLALLSIFCAPLAYLLWVAALGGGAVGAGAAGAAAPCLATSGLALWVLLPRRVVAERVEALPGLGLACSALWEDGAQASRALVPQRAIACVVLNEGISACSVHHYLAVLVRQGEAVQDKLFLPLLTARPKLAGLLELFQGLARMYNKV